MTTPVNAGDLTQRVSFVSATTPAEKDKDITDYVDLKSPTTESTLDLEDGALRDGGAPKLWSRECFGLYAQYAAVGLIYGTLPSVIYPFLSVYLNMEGTQTASARVLVIFPWSFKVFYGILSDCVPIFGFRRRPYMLIGWGITLVVLLWMACSDIGKPYYPSAAIRDLDASEVTAAIEATYNTSAPSKGGRFIILMMCAAIGYVWADVAADGVVVEFAQREPEAYRGRIQSAIYFVRSMFKVLSNLLQMFLFNGTDYGGDYSFSLSFPMLMLALGVCLVPVIPITWFYIPEVKVTGISFKKYCSDFWDLLQNRAMYQIVAYKFVAHVLDSFVYTASDPIANYWIHVSNFNNNFSTLLSNVLLAASIYATGKWGLHWSWRSMSAYTMIGMVIVDAITTLLGVWDVFRDQWLWLGGPVLETLPSGVNFIIGTYVVVELAGIGNEAAVYGLVTTVQNLASPVASTIAKNIDSLFDVTNKDIKRDDHTVRMQVTYTILIMYAAKLGSLLFLPMLPRQRLETQALIKKGGRSKWWGGFTIFYLMFALCWSIMTNILSIYPSTKCLRIAGGSGC